MPACTPGWRVLMRPSIISGNPVSSLTGWASIAASWIACSVLPVAYSSNPSRLSPRANAGSPVLSLTDRSAVGKPCLHQPDRRGEDPVLSLVDPLAQCLHRIAFEDWNGLLEEDRTGVEVGSHDVDGRSVATAATSNPRSMRLRRLVPRPDAQTPSFS